jgi:hypothetical protein
MGQNGREILSLSFLRRALIVIYNNLALCELEWVNKNKTDQYKIYK